MISGPMPARCSSSLSTRADRSAACMADSPPLRLPTGVRTASTMTVSRICLLRSRYRPPTSKRRVSPLGEGGIRFACILGGEIDALRTGFVGQRVTHGPVGTLVEQRLGLRQRDRRADGQPIGGL